VNEKCNFIGGLRDGEKITVNHDIVEYINRVERADLGDELFGKLQDAMEETVNPHTPFIDEVYILKSWSFGGKLFRAYVREGMSEEQMMERLLRGYRVAKK